MRWSLLVARIVVIVWVIVNLDNWVIILGRPAPVLLVGWEKEWFAEPNYECVEDKCNMQSDGYKGVERACGCFASEGRRGSRLDRS